MSSPVDIVVNTIMESVYNFIKRLCECEKLKEEYKRDMELAAFADEITRAIADGRSGKYGPVEIYIKRKLFGKREILIKLWEKEINSNSFFSELSKARAKAAWIQSDCSDQSLLEIIYQVNDRYTIDFIQQNLNKFIDVCRGKKPNLDFGELPKYAVDGITQGIEKFLWTR